MPALQLGLRNHDLSFPRARQRFRNMRGLSQSDARVEQHLKSAIYSEEPGCGLADHHHAAARSYNLSHHQSAKAWL